jgi:ABC-type transporter Mla MlaB component
LTAQDKPAADALAGDWTIDRAAELHALLRERIDGGAERLDLSGIGEFDSSGLQLLLAARRSAAAAGRALRLAGAPEPVRALCATYGLDGLLDGSATP